LRILDKLAHVVNNDSRLSLNGGFTLGQTTLEEWDHESKGGLMDIGDESGSTEQVNGLGYIFGLCDTLDKFRDETLDISVGDKSANFLGSAIGVFLDLRLCIPHGLGNDRNEVRNTICKLSGRVLAKNLDELEAGHLLLPFQGVAEGVDDVGEDGLDGVGIDSPRNSERSGLRRFNDWHGLITDGGKDLREECDKIWLDSGGNVGVRGDGLDGISGTLTTDSILLVGELLLEDFKQPENCQSKTTRL
jgi:hypothetical protein